MTGDELADTRVEVAYRLKALAPEGADQVQVVVYLVALLAAHQDDAAGAIDDIAEMAKDYLPTIRRKITA